jgi:TolB protein
MPKFSRLFLFSMFIGFSSLAQAQREIPVDIIVDKNTIPVRITASTPELEALARQAFGVHGRYRVVAGGQDYEMKFSLLTPTQVRVDITATKAGRPFSSDTATGSSTRNALLRAADIAVTKTNALGLRGFFAAKLTFIRDLGPAEEVCTSDLFFGEIKQVTNDRAHALTPRWSPDGSKIVYSSFFQSTGADIYQIDLKANRRTAFASFQGTNTGARFSPTGAQAVIVASGSGVTQIYTTTPEGRMASPKTRSDAVKASPCFSPDGSRIVFEMQPGPQLYVMPAAGGTPQRLSTGFNYASEADWSTTNPNLIACTVRTGGAFQIAVYDFSKGQAEVASKAPFDGIEPSWLADGRHLVYTARTRTDTRICVLDTATGKSIIVSPKSFGNVLQANAWNGP